MKIEIELPTPSRRVVGIALVLLVVAAAAVFWFVRDRGLPEDAVMRWDDTVVTEEQLDKRIAVLEAVYGVTVPDGGDEADEFRRDAAKSMAVSTLLEQEAARRDIAVARKTASDQLTRMISDDLGGDRDRFVDFLADKGIEEDDVIDEIVRTITTQKLYDAVTADVDEVTVEDAQKEFEDRKADMVSPERRVLRNIVVASKEDADAVIRRLERGASFAAVAEESSLDGSTRKDGGLLGELVADELEPAVAEVAFAATQGDLYGPVQTQYGWNVGRVDKVIAAQPLQFDEVSELLLRQLRTERALRVWGPWLGKLLRTADVEYADRYRPEDPDSIPSELEVPQEGESAE